MKNILLFILNIAGFTMMIVDFADGISNGFTIGNCWYPFAIATVCFIGIILTKGLELIDNKK